MPDTSPTLSLPYLLPSQAQKHVTHNEALQLLDVAVQTVVADRDRTEPPGSPAFGDCHIVAAGGVGDWAGQDGRIAQFNGSDWGFFAAKQGWRAQVLAEGRAVVFDGAGWVAQVSVPDMLSNLDGVGVGTASDATNRLAVAAPATLLSHEGAGHQLKINKSGAGDTASLLFQTDWSGRAEMGTAGTDDFAIKVSADGAAWITGVSFDAATGQAALPQGAHIDGAVVGTAVQQSADDTTAGRLMRADYGYGPGNLLGVVSQSGGLPTGAVIERGSNANGEYMRYADGTQICTCVADIDVTSTGGQNFDYPAVFEGRPAAFLGHRTSVPNAALEFGNIQGVVGWGSTSQYWTVKLKSGGSSTAPGTGQEQLALTALGRWF